MNPKKILVTGASGFLGCRLAERLLFAEKVPFKPMAHNPGSASRLARLPVEIEWCDLTDSKAVRKSLEGCDVVVHCAYGAAGAHSANRRATVGGTRILAEAAVASGVRRFVHISSIAVHSYMPPADVTEETPLSRIGDEYCKDKIEAEKTLWKFHSSHGLPLVVLRMGNIYGPYSGPWTVRPIAHIHGGVVSLIDGGHHASNMVFVDNAIEAILCAIREDEGQGQAFFIADDPSTWAELYGKYADWIGKAPVSTERASIRSIIQPAWNDKVRLVGKDLWGGMILPTLRYGAFRFAESKYLGPLASAIWKPFPEPIKERILGCRMDGSPVIRIVNDEAKAVPPPLPPAGLLQVYAGRARFSNEKARRILGYRARVDFDSAMRITEAWARWARLV